MKKAILVVVLLFSVSISIAQDSLTQEHKKVLADFISYFKNNEKEEIALLVSYPLKREFPIPEIKNREEFLIRFNEVFDSKLIAMIVNSNPYKDWSAVGWRGIMLDNGSVWLDYDGSLIAVNYQSHIEVKKKAELIESEKSNLHPSINTFNRPICILLTKKYRIRIDEIGDGSYRYTSWKKTAKMSDKPDLVIQNGEYVSEGSGGNHHYTFKNGKYTYECGIVIIGEDNTAPAYLTIYKENKEIYNESADLVTP